MSRAKICICQLGLTLQSNTKNIYNLGDHIKKITKCLELAKEKEVDYIIFPEYTYTEELENIYMDFSNYLTIIGGSYKSKNNYNETVIAHLGKIYYYKKMHLSPYELTVFSDNLNEGSKNPFYFNDRNGYNISVLTCMDFYEELRNVALSQIDENAMVDIVFSPDCNNNPGILMDEANSTHNRRDSFYSILCNISELNIIGNDGSLIKQNTYGQSCVFGLYDSMYRDQILDKKLTKDYYRNMIFCLPDGENIALVTLEVPYQIHRRSTMEYTPNPTNIQIIPIEDL